MKVINVLNDILGSLFLKHEIWRKKDENGKKILKTERRVLLQDVSDVVVIWLIVLRY